MSRTIRWTRRTFLAAGALPCVGSGAQGSHPGRPIRMIIPFAAGGATAALGREVGQAMAPALGQACTVDNLGGGAGGPALNAAGHTVPFCASGNTTAQPLLATQRADVLDQFEPVGMVAPAPHVLAASAKAPSSTVAQRIARAKAHPGAVNSASAGTGGPAHPGTELFARHAGIRVTHVPCEGAAQAITDPVAGQVQAIFGTFPSFAAMIHNGAIRTIGMTAPSTAAPLRELPLISRSPIPHRCARRCARRRSCGKRSSARRRSKSTEEGCA